MKKQTEQEQKLVEENTRLKKQIKDIHTIANPDKPQHKILHLPKK